MHRTSAVVMAVFVLLSAVSVQEADAGQQPPAPRAEERDHAVSVPPQVVQTLAQTEAAQPAGAASQQTATEGRLTGADAVQTPATPAPAGDGTRGASGTSEQRPTAAGFIEAVAHPEFPLWAAAAILLALTVGFVVGFVVTVRREAPRVESHWGGFGGGLGGWRASPSLVCLIASIAFAWMLAATAAKLTDMRSNGTKPDAPLGDAEASSPPAQSEGK